MKQILFLFSTLLATAVYGQAETKDSTIKVLYTNKTNNLFQPAYFINGKFVGQFSLDPKFIDDINVVKGEIQIDGIKYIGQIFIKTKSDYNPKLISLAALKDKYTNLKNMPVVFTIDGNIVNADYDKYVIDENYVLQIIVDNIKNTKENIDLGLIKLLTKTEENIQKSKEIRIRGGEVTLN
jgi:hypothetical protein